MKYKKTPGWYTSAVFKYLFMILCSAMAILPIVWVVLSAFKTNKEIMANGLALPEHYNLDGFKQALDMAPIFKFFFNSFVVATIATFFVVLFLAMAGYVFAKKQFRGKNLLYSILSLSMVIPTTALMSPIYTTMTKLGLYDTKAGLILVYTALNMPVSLMIMRSTFSGIPKELEEASYLDGAGFIRTFFLVMMPCAKGGLISVAVLSFLECWNEFTFALLLTSSESVRTLPLSLSYFTSQFSFNYTAMFAAITIAVVPSIIIFAIFQKQINDSIVAGSIKG